MSFKKSERIFFIVVTEIFIGGVDGKATNLASKLLLYKLNFDARLNAVFEHIRHVGLQNINIIGRAIRCTFESIKTNKIMTLFLANHKRE